jgi:hypothetical protein
MLSSAATLICVLLVVSVLRFLFAEKRRRLLEETAAGADETDPTP